jgi:hypothetical protein
MLSTRLLAEGAGGSLEPMHIGGALIAELIAKEWGVQGYPLAGSRGIPLPFSLSQRDVLRMH